MVHEVTSDERPAIDRMALLMEFWVSWRRHLSTSSLKLHGVDKLSTSVVPGVDPLCNTGLIEIGWLLNPGPSLLIIGADASTSGRRRDRASTLSHHAQLSMRFVLKELFREEERVLTQSLVEGVISERLLVSSVVIDQADNVLVMRVARVLVGC